MIAIVVDPMYLQGRVFGMSLHKSHLLWRYGIR